GVRVRLPGATDDGQQRPLSRLHDLSSPVPGSRTRRRTLPPGAVGVLGRAPHPITSSASNCIELGTESPRVFAALKLITNSSLTDRCTGRSAGCSTLTIRTV